MLKKRKPGFEHLRNSARTEYFDETGEAIGVRYEAHTGPAPTSGRVYLVVGNCAVRRATIRQLLSRGATVFFYARPTSDIRRFVEECRARTKNLRFIAIDPDTFEGQKQLLRAMTKVTPRPDGFLFMRQPMCFLVETHDAAGILVRNWVLQVSPFHTIRGFTPDDVAAKIVFLFGDDGQHMPEQTLRVGIAAGAAVPAELTTRPRLSRHAQLVNQRGEYN